MADQAALLQGLSDAIADPRVPVELSPLLMEVRSRLKVVGAYLIWSNEHSAWWRSASAGYTTHIEAAGIYSRDEALLICKTARNGWKPGAPPPELPIKRDDALACSGYVDADPALANYLGDGRS